MKNQIIKQIEPFYSNTGRIDRENSITLTLEEYTYEPRKKPSESIIQELREQKKQILQAKKERIDNVRTIEVSIGKVLQIKNRCSNKGKFKKNNKINNVIKLLKELQLSRKIVDFNRNFINNIIENNTNLTQKTKQRYVNVIINKTKSKTERIVTKRFLGDYTPFERKFKGEKSFSKIPKREKAWKERNVIITFYSFI